MRRKGLKGIEIDPSDLPSELNELLEEFVETLIEKDEREKMEIGKINELTRQAFEKWRNDQADLKEEFEFRKKMLERKVVRELKAEFEPRFDVSEKIHKDLWTSITDELGVPDDLELSLNHKTGIVSQYIDFKPNETKH
jgi:hypothetical protein